MLPILSSSVKEGVGTGCCFELEKGGVICWRRLKSMFAQLSAAVLNHSALDLSGSRRGSRMWRREADRI